MKRMIIFLMLFILFTFDILHSSDESKYLVINESFSDNNDKYVNSITTDDPNWDPNWDWTENKQYNLYIRTEAGLVNTGLVSLPYFYAYGGPAASQFNSETAGVRDIYPADGWLLFYRDFGTPERGVNFPMIILYNKYRGILRVFFYNIRMKSYSYGIGILKPQAVGAPSTTLTFMDSINVCSDSEPTFGGYANYFRYNPTRVEVCFGKLECQTWNYADFTVAGYDPNVTQYCKFELEVAGVDTSNITGTIKGSLNGVFDSEKASVGTSKDYVGEVISLGQNAWKSYKDADKLIDDIDKYFRSTQYYSVMSLKPYNVNDLGAIIGAVSFAATVVQKIAAVVDGKNPKASQPAKFSANISLGLEGKITHTEIMPMLLMKLPRPTYDADETDIPFYKDFFGVFSIERPIVIMSDTLRSALILKEEVPIIINPAIASNVIDIKARIHGSNDWRSILSDLESRYWKMTSAAADPHSWGTHGWLAEYSCDIMLLLKRDGQQESDPPIALIKTFPARRVMSPKEIVEAWARLQARCKYNWTHFESYFTIHVEQTFNFDNFGGWFFGFSEGPIVSLDDASILLAFGEDGIIRAKDRTVLKSDVKLTFKAGDILNVNFYVNITSQSYSIAITKNGKTFELAKDYLFAKKCNGIGSKFELCTNRYSQLSFEQPIKSDFSTNVITDLNENTLHPNSYSLAQNSPNPFNNTTIIDFSLSGEQNVSLNIYNLMGQHIITLINGKMSNGKHRIIWDSKDENGYYVSSGIYIYAINSGEFCEARKMLLLR